ncbi:MAG TPA: hypothetical protein VJ729_08565 [Nitrososphaeraceae archaeon]|nr:hypothetical protein [Nitrososphaeraceae archaeon]
MAALAQNMGDILYFQTVTLPTSYAQKVLDKNHNGLLSLQEASKDLTFQRLIGGNIRLILTRNLPNGTRILNPKDNPNNDTYINIGTELRPALVEQAKSFFSPSNIRLVFVLNKTDGRCSSNSNSNNKYNIKEVYEPRGLSYVFRLVSCSRI